MSDKKPYFISYKRITTMDQLTELRTFAEEFDHKIYSGDLSGVIIVVHCDGEMIGYLTILKKILAFPAWHPTKSTPYMVKKAISELSGWAKIEAAFENSDICGFIARSDDSPFSDDIMKKLNLESTEMKIFRVRGQ